MKNISIILLTLLLIVPPLQAHSDAIVFEKDVHIESLHNSHQNTHHENDTEEEKSKEHHHHCTVVTVSAEFIPIDYSYSILIFSEVNKTTNFYQTTYYNSYLSAIFQPPRS